MEAGNESVRRKQPQPPQVDEAGLADFLSTQPDVVAAYLFGSLADGRATPHSDVDTAILLADASDPMIVVDRQLQLMGEDEVILERLLLLRDQVVYLKHERDTLHTFLGLPGQQATAHSLRWCGPIWKGSSTPLWPIFS